MASILNKFINQFIERAGDFNPQLFRELKSRFNPRNITIVAAMGILGQIALVFLFYGSLPLNPMRSYNRYCLGSPPPNWEGYSDPNAYVPDNFCTKDLLGNTIINWQLWGLDIFTTVSVIGITILLVVGTYLLIADLAKEETRGTLNFIRLSPQSAKTIFLGKLLGVPALLYWLTLLAIPLHFVAGLMANIPILLILAFYGVLIASCAFFFHLALLMGLTNSKSISTYSFTVSSGLFFYLMIMMAMTLAGDRGGSHSPVDWAAWFYPGKALVYLVQSTFLPFKTVNYLEDINLIELLWYGQPIFNHAWSAIAFMLVNYGIWTYAITRAINRRFRRPHSVWLSKKQSYGLTLSFIIITLGFVPQTTSSIPLYYNFVILQFLLFAFFMVLTGALSPQRQTLQDWARYRHQLSQTPRSMIKDLIWGEQSPSTLAIALNGGIIFLYTLPAILIFPLENYQLPVIMGLLLGLSINLFYALIFQRFLLFKTPNRLIGAVSFLVILAVFPLIAVVIVGARFTPISSIWFLTFMPMAAGQLIFGIASVIALLCQWTLIILVTGEMTQKLKSIGSSESKRLMETSAQFSFSK
jgi:hypothetical protein